MSFNDINAKEKQRLSIGIYLYRIIISVYMYVLSMMPPKIIGLWYIYHVDVATVLLLKSVG